jgi:hypothetical protein
MNARSTVQTEQAINPVFQGLWGRATNLVAADCRLVHICGTVVMFHRCVFLYHGTEDGLIMECHKRNSKTVIDENGGFFYDKKHEKQNRINNRRSS